MGDYGPYILGSFAIATVMLSVLAFMSWRGARRAASELAKLEASQNTETNP